MLLLGSLAFCLSASAKPAKLSKAIVGTWRWLGVDGRAVDEPFYLRYDPDGTCASWPVPKDWPNAKGVSRGKYSVTKDTLILDTGRGKSDPKARLILKGNQMVVTTEDSHQLIYRRMIPALEPGKYEPRKS